MLTEGATFPALDETERGSVGARERARLADVYCRWAMCGRSSSVPSIQQFGRSSIACQSEISSPLESIQSTGSGPDLPATHISQPECSDASAVEKEARKGKEEYLYSAFSHQGTYKALRHGSHRFTRKQHHACLSFVAFTRCHHHSN